MGAFFINVNTRMAVLRKKLLVRKWMKPLETFMWCFATASAFYWVPFFFNSCIPIGGAKLEEYEDMDYLGWCDLKSSHDSEAPKLQEYNALASYFWAGEGQIIKNIL